jgi:hypothetical protein
MNFHGAQGHRAVPIRRVLQRGWHRFYSAASTLIVRVAVHAQVTLGALRHLLIGHIFNCLDHHKLDRRIPAITVGALSNKAPGFVINTSDCSRTTGNTNPDGGAPLQAALRQSVAVASAHKSGLQSFSGYLWLKTRFQRER